jgi:hypothetical protein
MPSQGPPLQNNQGTVKILVNVLHITLLYYYIYSFSALASSLLSGTVSYHFHCIHVYIATFHRPTLLILSNKTNIDKHDSRVYYVPFKWQLPAPAPTNDFRMAVPESTKKKLSL